MRMAFSPVSVMKKPYLEMEYHASEEWLYINWIGPIKEELNPVGAEEVLLALEKYPVKKILNDNRQLTGSWDTSIRWLIDHWFPRFLGTGCFYMA